MIWGGEWGSDVGRGPWGMRRRVYWGLWTLWGGSWYECGVASGAGVGVERVGVMWSLERQWVSNQGTEFWACCSFETVWRGGCRKRCCNSPVCGLWRREWVIDSVRISPYLFILHSFFGTSHFWVKKKKVDILSQLNCNCMSSCQNTHRLPAHNDLNSLVY